jgi:hypothetical protein
MGSIRDYRPLAYWIVIAGCVLSFAVAVVPNYGAGYKLDITVLITGLLPYFVYGTLTETLKGWVLAAPGVVLLVSDALLRIPARLTYQYDFAGDTVYLVSLLWGLLILPAVGFAFAAYTRHRDGGAAAGSGPAGTQE